VSLRINFIEKKEEKNQLIIVRLNLCVSASARLCVFFFKSTFKGNRFLEGIVAFLISENSFAAFSHLQICDLKMCHKIFTSDKL
jgi:hypothetical protein